MNFKVIVNDLTPKTFISAGFKDDVINSILGRYSYADEIEWTEDAESFFASLGILHHMEELSLIKRCIPDDKLAFVKVEETIFMLSRIGTNEYAWANISDKGSFFSHEKYDSFEIGIEDALQYTKIDYFESIHEALVFYDYGITMESTHEEVFSALQEKFFEFLA